MNAQEKDDNILAILGFCLGAFIMAMVFACLHAWRNDSWRDDLVKSGHAEYYLDANHNRQWRLIPLPPKGGQ